MNKIQSTAKSLNITGKNIKQIRKEKKITQEDLCARMQIMGFKISRSDISKLETGKRFINDVEVVGFSKALKVSILDLYKEQKRTLIALALIKTF